MKFLFVPVNYNSYDMLENYINAVFYAYEKADNDHIQIDICIADNSPKPKELKTSNKHNDHIKINIKRYDNPGYLNAALKNIYARDLSIYDYIVISNVDVIVEEDFFKSIKDLNIDKQTAWIAPSIYSSSEKRDVNPKIINRYSKKRLELLRLLFYFPRLWHFYAHTLYKRKSINITPAQPQQKIYAGHGSFMIFTSDLFLSCLEMNYPVFLFCEEIFLAEMVASIGKITTYCPSVKVKDMEHVSTSKMKLSQYCKYNYEALSYIIKRFYE